MLFIQVKCTSEELSLLLSIKPEKGYNVAQQSDIFAHISCHGAPMHVTQDERNICMLILIGPVIVGYIIGCKIIKLDNGCKMVLHQKSGNQ